MKPKTIFRRMAFLMATLMCALGANAAEAYACYTESNTTLTFYYDNNRSSRSGTTYSLNTGTYYPGWYNDDTCENVTKVVFNSSFANARPTLTQSWFYGMQNLQSIEGISNLNTSEVTDMGAMFMHCSELTSIDVSHFNTAKVTDMHSMFYGCSSLTSLDVSNFNTTNVTDIRSMFRNCTGLTRLDLSNFNTAQVVATNNMFNGCTNLTTIYVGSEWTTDGVKTVRSLDMFLDCTSLVGGMGTTYDANHINKEYACLDRGITEPGYFTAEGMEAYAYYNPVNQYLYFCYDNQRSTLTDMTTYDLNANDGSMPGWYSDGTYRNVKYVHFDPAFAYVRPKSTLYWFYGMNMVEELYSILYLRTDQVTDMNRMFDGCSSLTSLDLGHFKTTKVTDMYGMFQGCTNLESIYVGPDWSTDAVTNSALMFANCTKLVGGQGTAYSNYHLDKSYAHIDGGTDNPGYLTEKPKEAYAFYAQGDRTLTFCYDNMRISRSNFGKVYYVNTNYNIPGWYSDGTSGQVTQVIFDPSFADARRTSAYMWFYGMQNLQSIEGLSNLNTSEMWNMSSMFNNCIALSSLDLSSFNTAKVTTMNDMFAHCSNLRTIFVGDGWSTAAVTQSDRMFTDCTSLVGGMGTTFDANHINKEYARLDRGVSNPGYFTIEGTEAYACYTPENTTLTFYYDNLRDTRTGTTYDLITVPTNRYSEQPDWYNDGTNANVTKVVFDASFAVVRPTSTNFWFESMGNLESITDISFLNTSEVTNMSYMFYGCSRLTSLDVSHFDTSKVAYMSGMFYGCSSLTSLDVSNWDTSEVIMMNALFRDCNSLKSLDVSHFDTSNVTSMIGVFRNCYSLTSLDLGNFNTAQVKNMEYMFYDCRSLNTIYVGDGWNTATTQDSGSMFAGCTSLVGGQGTAYNASNPMDKTYAHLDGGTSNPGYFTNAALRQRYVCYTPENTTLAFYYDAKRSTRTGTIYDLNTGDIMPGWYNDDTYASVTKVVFDPSFADVRPTTTYYWFNNMQNLQTIEGLSNLNTSEVTKMTFMFSGCSSLTSLDLRSFNMANVTNMGYMFYGCSGLTSLDLSRFNTANVTNMSMMFYGCSNLKAIYVGDGWSTDAVTSSNYMFHNCTSLKGGKGTTYKSANPKDKTYAHIDGGTDNPGYFSHPPTEAYAVCTASNTKLMFYYDNRRSSRPGTTFDLNEGDNGPRWCGGDVSQNVTKVVFDPSFADARPVSTFLWFAYMQNLQSIEGISNLNTSEVTNMSNMFFYCQNLASLDVSNFDTHNVTKMTGMFQGCEKLQSLDLSSWNTSKVTDMPNMFASCSSLSNLDVSGWNTSNVTDMHSMFSDCTSLTNLDLSNFNTAQVSLTILMFKACSNLQTIYVGDGWSTAAVTQSDRMFTGCTNLVGGMGTTYDAEHANAAYAHIDGGTGNPGYFSERQKEAYAFYNQENTTLTFYYDKLRSRRKGTTYGMNRGNYRPGWSQDYSVASSITTVVFDQSFATALPATTAYWFADMVGLRTITGLENLNTNFVTDMSYMFSNCGMPTLDLTSFNTSLTRDMSYMFYRCKAASIDLSSFNTSSVTTMERMFSNCYGLTNLDLSSFNTARVEVMTSMFDLCAKLKTISVGTNWSTDAVTESDMMFFVCFDLVGGQGTAYSVDNPKDKTYAHIDGGTSNPGYFTAFLLGDVNLDGVVNAADIAALANIIIGNPPAVYSRKAADLNGDNNVSIQDLTRLIRMLLP